MLSKKKKKKNCSRLSVAFVGQWIIIERQQSWLKRIVLANKRCAERGVPTYELRNQKKSDRIIEHETVETNGHFFFKLNWSTKKWKQNKIRKLRNKIGVDTLISFRFASLRCEWKGFCSDRRKQLRKKKEKNEKTKKCRMI